MVTLYARLRAWWRLVQGQSDAYVSEAWLLRERQQASRVEFHGVTWAWPVRKEWE